MYSHDSPPQQPEIPRYDAPFLPGANAAPPPMSPPPMPVPPAQEKTTRSRPKALPPFPVSPEVRKTKTPPTPRTSQRTPLPQKRRRPLPLWVKIVLPLVVVLLLAFSGLALVSHFTNPNNNHPAWTVVQNFYSAMQHQNYQQAYRSHVSKMGLRDGILTLPSSHIYSNATDFANACKAIDAQKGRIIGFSVTSFSTFNAFNDPVTASVTVTRGKQSYTANIGLVQEGKFWKIDYVDNL